MVEATPDVYLVITIAAILVCILIMVYFLSCFVEWCKRQGGAVKEYTSDKMTVNEMVCDNSVDRYFVSEFGTTFEKWWKKNKSGLAIGKWTVSIRTDGSLPFIVKIYVDYRGMSVGDPVTVSLLDIKMPGGYLVITHIAVVKVTTIMAQYRVAPRYNRIDVRV